MTAESELVETRKEHASVSQTIINMAKTCMGTGCLALPFAARQGGMLLHVFGLLGIAIWNIITIDRLCKCYDLVTISKRRSGPFADPDAEEAEELPLKQSSRTTTSLFDDSSQSYQSIPPAEDIQTRPQGPPKGTTTLVKLAWYATGQWGANLLDIIMCLYLIGILVTYLNAMRTFLTDTGVFTTGIGFVDSFILSAIMFSLSVVPHTGRLAKASAMGLLVLLVTFLVIAWYGFVDPLDSEASINQDGWQILTGDASFTDIHVEAQTSLLKNDDSWWFPQEGITGVSKWFGIVVFGFGVTPLTFNFREAMEEPQHIGKATWWAMFVVAGSYLVVGAGLLFPFPDIDGDVLHELPPSGWVPTLTRVAMVVVVLVTAPLLLVPCGELLEGKLVGLYHQENDDNPIQDENKHSCSEWHIKVGVRGTICLVCAAISSFVPGFVNVLSFVGCCCVAVVSFCLPPFLHLALSLQKASLCPDRASSAGPLPLTGSVAGSLIFDLALFLWGLLATVISTFCTFHEVSE